MLAGAAFVAYADPPDGRASRWIDAPEERIDGLTVIALFVFAIGLMDGVRDSSWRGRCSSPA